MRCIVVLSLVLFLSACATPRADREPDAASSIPLLADRTVAHEVVKEVFVTASTPHDNVDSPASWIQADGRLLLLATAKASGRLLKFDGESGASLGHLGQVGTNAQEFDRPNGIFVLEDWVFVVERDNHRIQVLSLPDMQSLGHFGDADLTQPYGIWVRRMPGDEIEALVTDAYMAGEYPNGDDIAPPLPELDRRMKRYRVKIERGGLSAQLIQTFGDTTAAGAILVPESIWGDPTNDRLLIAEEDTRSGTAVREYDLDGTFKGRSIGLGLFQAQAEGISLWACPDGTGYWITTDQFKDRSVFHLFDRQSLAHIGAFSGEQVGNTDGIWLQQAATARFPDGVFYAVHDDQAVGAFDWRDISAALKIPSRCE